MNLTNNDSFQAEHLPDSTLNDLGKQLRMAREHMRMGADHVAAELNLSVKVIHELETDLVNCSAPSVYLRGYLRAYAKLVHLDQSLVDRAMPLLGFQPANTTTQTRTPIKVKETTLQDNRIKQILTIVGVSIILLMLIWWSTHSNTTETTPPAITTSVTPPTPATQPIPTPASSTPSTPKQAIPVSNKIKAPAVKTKTVINRVATPLITPTPNTNVSSPPPPAPDNAITQNSQPIDPVRAALSDLN